MIPYRFQWSAMRTALHWWRGRRNYFLLELPTGSGKSLVAAMIAKEITRGNKQNTNRVLVLSDSSEIIRQDANEVAGWCGLATVGALCEGTGSFNVQHCRTLVASIQSLHGKEEMIGRQITHVIIDEAQKVGPFNMAMYSQTIARLRNKYPQIHVMGLTATLRRLDQGAIFNGKSLWREVAYTISPRELMEMEFLARPNYYVAPYSLTYDTKELRADKDGEFRMGDVVNLVRDDGKLGMVLDDAIAQLDKADAWPAIVLVPSIEIAERVAQHMSHEECDVVPVHTKRSRDHNERAISLFKAGHHDGLASVGMLSTGFNAKNVRSIVNLRPTNSWALWHQGNGRGMRKDEGKSSFLILDYVEGVDRHGKIEEHEGTLHIKARGHNTCPDCGANAPTMIKTCCCKAKMKYVHKKREGKANGRTRQEAPALHGGMGRAMDRMRSRPS